MLKYWNHIQPYSLSFPNGDHDVSFFAVFGEENISIPYDPEISGVFGYLMGFDHPNQELIKNLYRHEKEIEISLKRNNECRR